MKRAWRALAAWSALGCMAVGTPVMADPPAADGIAVIEQYQGLKRVDNFSQPVQSAAKPRRPIEPETVTFASAPFSGQPRTLVPAHDITITSNFDPGVVKSGFIAENVGFIRPSYAKPGPASVPPGASKYEFQPIATASAEPAPTSPKALAEQVVESRPKQSQAEPSVVIVNPPREVREVREAREDGTLSAVSTLLGTILTPLAVLAGVWIVVRYLQGRSGPLIRIEHIGGVYAAPVAPIENPGPPNPYTIEMPPTPIEETSTAQTFELGPTFEEERLAREQQAQQQEEGVLRQLFDDNIKLQKQLMETHDEWLGEASAEAESTTPAESQAVLT